MSWGACYSAASASEAHFVKGFLELRGVPCLLASDGPTVYPSVAIGVRVLVPEAWLLVAQKMVARRAGRRQPGSRVVRLPRRSPA